MASYPYMQMKVQSERKLYFKSSTSNKEYWVTLAQDRNRQWLVIGSWGPRGSVGQNKVYLMTSDVSAAIKRANKLLDDKIAKGYESPRLGVVHFTALDFGTQAVARPRVVVIEPEPQVAEPIAETLFG